MMQVFQFDDNGLYTEPLHIFPVSYTYKTSDGKEFLDEIEAKEHQGFIDKNFKILAIPTYEIPENCTDKLLPTPNWKPKFNKEIDDWEELCTSDEIALLTGNTLDNLKKNKKNELNQSCNEAILSGFNHIINGVEYHFNFDTEAQLNFQGAERLIDKGLVSEMQWTVSHDGQYERITINKSIMDELVIKILQHKDGNIRKLRDDLMPIVESAMSKEELNIIVW